MVTCYCKDGQMKNSRKTGHVIRKGKHESRSEIW